MNNRVIGGALILLALLFVIAYGWGKKPVTIGDCPVKTEEKTVRGNSLFPLVKNEDTIQAAFGYYDCHAVRRDDVVLFKFAGDEVPLIKIVRGVPGDGISLRSNGNRYEILVNGAPLDNSEGERYELDESGRKILSLYIDEYKGVIPTDTYLLLGNLARGSIDSSRFGLVDRSDILARVEP
jgi:signal peptidase I